MRNLLVVCLIIFGSCSFLEEQSDQYSYVKNCEDLSELLIGSGYMRHVAPGSSFQYNSGQGYMAWLHVLDDDGVNYTVGNSSHQTEFQKVLGFYTWNASPFVISGTTIEDWEWKRFYAHINSLNAILSQADEVEGSDKDRKRIKGEAQFLRAGYYFLLANIYALPYEKDKAATTLGVPLKLTEYIDKNYFSRDPLSEVYGQIVRDLKGAVVNLDGVVQRSIYRANEVAARLLLSRVYLYMGEWQLALDQCDSIRAIGGYSVLDISESDGSGDFTYRDSPETIFSQGTYALYGLYFPGTLSIWDDGSWFKASDDLLACFDQENDKRYSCCFVKQSLRVIPLKFGREDIEQTPANADVSDCFLLRYPEVLLNMAEALAMLDRDEEAIRVLEELMEKRYAPGTMPTITKTGEDLVNYIRDERRREFCFEGHRWFDLRRYAVSSKYPLKKDILHEVYGANNTYEATYKLKALPEGKGWVLQIPAYELEFNRETMEPNDRESAETI